MVTPVAMATSTTSAPTCTHLHPLLAARREREVMRTPVAHHMLAVAPFGRQALALVEPVVGAGAAGCLRVAMAGGLRLPCLR